MLDFFKKPVVIVIVLIAIVIALIWSAISNWQENRKQAQQEQAIEETIESETIINLTNIDPADFDEQIKQEYVLATEKAVQYNSKNIMAAISIELISLDINSGTSRYIYIAPNDKINNWTIAFSQLTGNYIRAIIPKDDYLGDLQEMNTNLWKFNYVTALQIAEQNGGLEWRENNDLSSATLILRHGDPNNWLIWIVEYQSQNDSFSIQIDANSGKVIEK